MLSGCTRVNKWPPQVGVSSNVIVQNVASSNLLKITIMLIVTPYAALFIGLCRRVFHQNSTGLP